jgi:CheY-like chemotaxis protein
MHMLTSVAQMPVRDGYSAAKAIRTEFPWKDIPRIQEVPIIALTASAIVGDEEKCRTAGMDVSAPSNSPSHRVSRV